MRRAVLVRDTLDHKRLGATLDEGARWASELKAHCIAQLHESCTCSVPRACKQSPQHLSASQHTSHSGVKRSSAARPYQWSVRAQQPQTTPQ